MAGHSKKEYWVIFGALTVLTGIEVFLPQLPLSWGLIVSGLFGLAIGKAVLVANFYMHLKSETKIFNKTIYFCLGIPIFYAVILVLESGWRLGEKLG